MRKINTFNFSLTGPARQVFELGGGGGGLERQTSKMGQLSGGGGGGNRGHASTDNFDFKGAIHLNAIFLPLDMALMEIFHSRFKHSKNPIIIP